MLTERSPQRLRGDQGSSLMLMPAAVLVLIILGAIAADLSHAHNAKRQLLAVANSAANDAVTYGVDIDLLRRSEETGRAYPLDEGRIRAAIQRSLDAQRSPTRDYDLAPGGIVIDEANRSVEITLRGRVEYLFAKALPGTAGHLDIEATGTAVAEEG